jgi:hypothetical protein
MLSGEDYLVLNVFNREIVKLESDQTPTDKLLATKELFERHIVKNYLQHRINVLQSNEESTDSR